MQNSKHRILLEDAFVAMEKMANNGETVDAIITDPPYQLANKNIIKFKSRKDMSRDFGEWDYFQDEEKFKTTGTDQYLEFMCDFLEVASRVLRPSGNLLLFSGMEKISHFIDMYEAFGMTHHATIIWHKTNPTPRVRKTGLLSSCEAILWAVNSKEKGKKTYTLNFGKQNEMHNFIQTPICMGKERVKHETQKPCAVIRPLFRNFTNPGDLILDPFAGSGTVAQVAEEFGCRSLSIEKDSGYFNVMAERLKGLPDLSIENSVNVIQTEEQVNEHQ